MRNSIVAAMSVSAALVAGGEAPIELVLDLYARLTR